MAVNSKKKTDPELLKQIDSVAAGDNSDDIQAVFSLGLPMKKLLDPKQVEEATHRVLNRAEKEAGSKPKEVNIFRNLGTFVVSADASFIREVINDPDISRAVANKQTRKNSK